MGNEYEEVMLSITYKCVIRTPKKSRLENEEFALDVLPDSIGVLGVEWNADWDTYRSWEI